nr:PREDICTED: uncharacterized protein LOC102198684 [Pundamilia nyererei]
MGNYSTIHNETPYTFHYCSKGREDVRTVRGNSTGQYLYASLPFSFRYGDHSESDLTGAGRGASYTIRESKDHKEFELVNNMSGSVVDRCPNFGRIDEEKREHEKRQQEERRRKEEEEKRRQAELERQRKIQEQMENETLRKKLSEAHNRLQEEENLKTWEHRQQHSHVLHQLLEDEAHHIERDEVADVNEKFEKLLSKYDIREDEHLQIQLEDRMKTLQNKLTLQYFNEHPHFVPTSLLWALDQTTGYVLLSLTERFNILEAVLKVTLEGDPDFEDLLQNGQDKKTEFLLSLQEQLHVADVNENFEKLLSKYDIREDEDLQIQLEDRMKALQNKLTLQYFNEYPHFFRTLLLSALDQTTGYVLLSLTERFNILEAVLKVTLEGDPDFEDLLQNGQDKKTEFLLSLQEQLHADNPTLAQQVLANVLDLSSKLPLSGREIVSQIVFNNLWAPKDIKRFLGKTLSMDQETVTKILHKACTYGLSCDDALSALNEDDPAEYIQYCVDKAERDKDAYTLLAEMESKNFPECVPSLLPEVLTYIEEELPKYGSVPINREMIEDCKKIITALDFNNPKIDALKKVLIIVSRAVKECTAFTTQSGEHVQGYFPRPSQLASLLLLLLPQSGDKKDELKTNMHVPERQANEITMYTISEKHNIEKQNFSPGNIIIATNLGGRGTDIHVQQDVNESGGLFVLLTYFPRSHRVERQVFGRTARKGNPGMVQMVLNQSHLAPAYQGHSIETMRQLREEYELRHLDSMEKHELCEIDMKETLFSSFCQFLCNFDKNYTVEERSDLSKMKLKDVPEYFKIHQNKFDYQTALDALKES